MKKNNFLKNCRVITGRSILVPVVIGLIWLVLLLIVFHVSVSGLKSTTDELSWEQSFLSIKASLFASGIGVGLMLIPIIFGSKLITFRKIDCYFLTVKDRFNTYKSYYFGSYFLYCFFAVLFIAIVYLSLFLNVKPAAHTLLLFIADELNILFAFSILPFVMQGKKIASLFFKGIILMFIYFFLNIYIMRANSLYIVICLAFAIPGLMFLSNHRWLKIMQAAYEDNEVQRKTKAGE